MGWVTLTLRKTELKRSHTDYQNELLQLSRRKRQMARQYAFQQLLVRNEQSADLRTEYDKYSTKRNELNDALEAANQNANGATTRTGLVYADGTELPESLYDSAGKDANGQWYITDSTGVAQELTVQEFVYTKTDIQNDLDAEYANYQQNVNDIKSQFEQELEGLEQEANDTETDLDQQQVQIEAQLEAISAEIEAVGQAVSSQVQSSTIKLA